MAAHQEEINLLPQKGFEATTAGRVLSWILTTFRIIVIVTEIIVMIAFLSRFWLDAQNTDLTDEIEEKKAILVASSNFENQFKDTQKRLKVFSEIEREEEALPPTLNNIVSSLPTDLFLTSVAFQGKSVQIEGSSPSEKSVQQLIVNLESTNRFEEISLTELGSDPKNVGILNFKLSTKLIEGGTK